MIKIKFNKKGIFAKTPKKVHKTDAAFDLYASEELYNGLDYLEYETGISLEIPENHVGLIFPRSSISNNNLSLSNSVGVIDENYRGTIKFRFYTRNQAESYKVGERIGQLLILPYPQIELEEVSELSSSERGTGSYGSTGK